MYTTHSTPIVPDTTFIQKYHQTAGLSSSIKKAGIPREVTVTWEKDIQLEIMEHRSEDMMMAQQLSVEKIWNSPEDDVWDEMYNN